MDYYRVCAALLGRGTVFRLNRLVGRPMRPRSITLTVTRRCNSHCIMCNIWRLERTQEELTREEMVRFLSDPRFSHLVELDLTGGEPFLRKDLPDFIAEVSDLKERSLTSLRTVALATNGLLTDRVCDTVGRMLSAAKGRFDLVIVCSLDGIGEMHDMVRGTPGCFSRVIRTIEGLKDLASGPYPLWVGMKTTILPNNWDQIPELIRFARENGLFHILSPVLFSRERFRNVESRKDLELLPRYTQDLVDLYSEDKLRQSYYSHVVTRTLKENGRNAACSAASDHFFVEGDGRVFPCPLIDSTLGNIKNHTVADLFVSPARVEAARRAGRAEECRWCLEPGCVRFSQTTEGYGFFGFILGGEGMTRFQQAYAQEGLDKYFSWYRRSEQNR